MLELKRILVATDFSRCSETAFKYAKFIAKRFSASIEILHVVDKRDVEKIAELYGESEDSVSQRLCLQAKERYQAFLAEHLQDGTVFEQEVAVGIPFQTIALKAQERAVDMIVMGGHGKMGSGQIDKIFFGSRAERVVRILPCPVLCVPPETADPQTSSG
ncbi:MAG: universal stress protein [Thermodesulfobacteriota bacterium]|nr:universal stress protein [Thermodesulfobacteriota bacterium]